MAVSMRIGTRKSVMALAQTEDIAQRLSKAALKLGVEIVRFETTGDSQTSKLMVHGRKRGAFVAEIRAAVTSGRLHAAMHSLNDMPGKEDTPGLVIGATLARDPPTDALDLRPGVSIDDLKRSRGSANRPRELGPAVGLGLLHKGAADILARTRPGSVKG